MSALTLLARTDRRSAEALSPLAQDHFRTIVRGWPTKESLTAALHGTYAPANDTLAPAHSGPEKVGLRDDEECFRRFAHPY